jgi:predicted secreted protein
MNWVSVVAVYAIVWWLVLFTTLPFGVRTPTDVSPGNEPGAPDKPHLWKKAAVTSVIAAVVTAAIMVTVSSGLVDFRDDLR